MPPRGPTLGDLSAQMQMLRDDLMRRSDIALAHALNGDEGSDDLVEAISELSREFNGLARALIAETMWYMETPIEDHPPPEFVLRAPASPGLANTIRTGVARIRARAFALIPEADTL